MAKTGTVRFVIAPGHPHHGKRLVVLGGVKFKDGAARVTTDDAQKVESMLANFYNVALEGSQQHEEFVRLYAGAAPDENGRKPSKAKVEQAVEKAHAEIEQEKFDRKLAVLMGDDDEEEEMAEIGGIPSGTPVTPGAASS